MTVNAAAAKKDFDFDQGDTETFKLTRENADGTAKDITGYTFWLTLKESKDDSDANAAVQKTVTNHTAPANGETELPLTASDTDGLQGSYYYDIQEKTDNGEINTLVKGMMSFDVDVTEST